MAGLRSFGLLFISIMSISSLVLLDKVHSTPVNISPRTVPDTIVQNAINYLNADSPTQHTYRGGNLISAQKLLEPELVIYRLTLNLETICSDGSSSCPREACAIDLKERSGEIEINRDSIQCMYLYPQSGQEEQQAEGSSSDTEESKNTLELDHEVEQAADSQRPEVESQENKPFIAVRAPSSNYCAGCPYELNANLPGLAAFGAQALDIMDRLGPSDFKHKLIRILRVTRAVPPGSNVVEYKLLAEIGESSCLKTALIERSECSLQGNIPVQVCLVTFEERPWQQSDRQVVSNNCTEPSELENEINASLNNLNGGIDQPERVDSVQEVIGKTAHIDQLAQEGKIGTYDSLIDQMLENQPNATPDLNVTEVPFFEGVMPREDTDPHVSPVQTAVPITEAPFVKVELEREEEGPQTHGFIDKEKEFEDFLSDFDIPVRKSQPMTEETRQPVTEDVIKAERVDLSPEEGSESDSHRVRRAVTQTSESRTLVQDLAQKVVDTLDRIDQDDKKRVLLNILNVKQERLDGVLYHLIIEVASTDCSEESSGDNCLTKETDSVKICKVQIHTREEDPLQSARVVKCECNKKSRSLRNRRTPGLLGEPGSISINDKDVKNYANLGLQKYSETFEGTSEPVLAEILSATQQTVAGSLYKIKVSFGPSDCAKGTTENCTLLADSEKKECEITAWSRPWLAKDALVITVNCNNEKRSRRVARQLGAPNSISVDDEDVKNYANLGLHKYSETAEGPNEPMVVDIISATYQVVAGTLFKIKVRVGTSDCPKGKKENCTLLADSAQKECEIQAWSRPWLRVGALDIKVNCDSQERKTRGLKGKNYSQKMLEQASFLQHSRLFTEFMAKYNKTYSTPSEKNKRLRIFHQNMMMVQELQRNEQGTAVYGASMFADLTTEEFKKSYLGLRPELRLDNEIPIPMAEIPDIRIPDEYDWRNFNAVTPVKNQGQCGSCWAFSVTGNVEGQYAVRHGALLSLSEQELVDCDTLDEGCSGGLPDNAYRAIEKLGGLELETDYPYDGENEACHFNKTEVKVRVVSAVNITSNETQMVQWLVQNGPISIGINANAMQFYMGGVSHPFKFLCSPDNLDHGVLIVGYGTHTYPIFHKTLPYWTIKNSWGPMWGEQGYYRVFRGDGTCGVNQMASSAIVA